MGIFVRILAIIPIVLALIHILGISLHKKKERIEPDRIELNRVKYDTVEFHFVKRGIIGINKIGYVL